MSYIDDFPTKKPVEKRTILEVGFDPRNAVFEIKDGKVKDCQSFVLDRISIDTTGLIKPMIKIDFSGLIAFEGEDEETYEPEVEVDLLFRLERVCGCVYETVQCWRYLKEIDVEDEEEKASLELELEISEPFTVIYSKEISPECCEYRMIVEGKDFEGEFEYLKVVKPTLTAIVQGKVHNC
jgi:hypothetical protein